ncbi:unnamed protein product [Oppiella nova]|uniref:Uncharacterized protein n=1 Tax=Oppiella nova TaxID=334625 RepID=A0A7R9QTD3_9ACAR|nr:unnamed protein product [Oppiella nova]CAG2173658.1 unnamed protein product [Oppiella nova]
MPTKRILVLICLCATLESMFTGLETSLQTNIEEFVERCGLRMNSDARAHLSSSISGAMTVSQALAIPLSTYISPKIILFIGAIWAGSIIYGLGIGPMYGTNYQLIEQITPLTDLVAVLFVLCPGAVEVLIQIILGMVMERHEIIGDKYVVKLVDHVLDANEAIEWVSDPTCGAVALFMGVTRRTESGDPEHRHVQCLVYEAYHSMAIKQMQTIVEQNIASYGAHDIRKCYMSHRLGRVGVGEASLLIACSGAHRRPAHQLVLKLVDDIKAVVPIWKRIHYTTDDGVHTTTEWSDKSEAFWISRQSDTRDAYTANTS